jgi:hypothetical protein
MKRENEIKINKKGRNMFKAAKKYMEDKNEKI